MDKVFLPKSLEMEWAMIAVSISPPRCAGCVLCVVSKDPLLLLMAKITMERSLCPKELKAPKRPYLAQQLLSILAELILPPDSSVNFPKFFPMLFGPCVQGQCWVRPFRC